jgi:hypothetical protein
LVGTGLFCGGLSLNTSLLISTHSVWSSVRNALPVWLCMRMRLNW